MADWAKKSPRSSVVTHHSCEACSPTPKRRKESRHLPRTSGSVWGLPCCHGPALCELFKVSRAALLSQASHQPPSPRGRSQLGFLKARSHFLPTRLTSGNLSGSFPEPFGFLHGHVPCLCSPHSQPGHWAPNRCQAEPGRHSCPGLWLPTAGPALPMPGGSVDSNWFSASQTTIFGQIP